MTRVRLFGSSQVIPSEKTAGLPNPQPSLPFRFYEKFVKGVVARIMFFLAAYIHFLLLWNPCSLRGESFWWYSATINSRVKTSKVDLSVKVMLPLYQALMLQGRTVRQQPPRRCLTIYFPSRSFFIRDSRHT